jgi:5-methylcytosine-specific restriction protein B
MLTPERLKELWTAAMPLADWSGWKDSYRTFLEKVAAMSDQELSTPEAQRMLWSANEITTLGPGGSVTVTGAFTDPVVVSAVVALRNTVWPVEPRARAEAVQAAGDAILALVTPKHGLRRPQARLWRLFAALVPAEFTCVFSYQPWLHVAEFLLPDGTGASHVLARARLRDVLGQEQGMEDHVLRSMFCWWLHEHFDTISAGRLPQVQPGVAAPAPSENVSAPVVLWPYQRQFKGNFAVRRLVDAYRDVLREAQGGIARADLVQTLHADPEFASLSEVSLGQLVSRVTSMGFLQTEGGILRPTPDGLELLEVDVPGALTHRMLERVFPMAALLRFLKGTEASNPELVQQLQKLYPNWTESMGPTSLLAWTKALGLVETGHGGKLRLSEYGAAWEARLPQELPTYPSTAVAEEPVDSLADVEDAPAGALQTPGFEAMWQEFQTDEEAKGHVFDRDQIAALHRAWHSQPHKRFVIIAGLSGTGKTAVVTLYARLCCKLLGLEPAKHLAVVPVSPDWRDPTGLIGYYNALHERPTFQVEPALGLLLRATEQPSRPFFLVLDEMNLARVEQYFAPFLSAMETGQGLVLHSSAESVNMVPPRIPWPKNLFIAGTVNMDETTHAFSDKVLDRAFTLEFWDVDLRRFFEQQPEPRDAKVEAIILEVHDCLQKARRQFGYRAAKEMLAFLGAANGVSANEHIRMLDQVLFSKVLPRLRGEATPELQAVLSELAAVFKKEGLVRCERKIASMDAALRTTGVTRFWS